MIIVKWVSARRLGMFCSKAGLLFSGEGESEVGCTGNTRQEYSNYWDSWGLSFMQTYYIFLMISFQQNKPLYFVGNELDCVIYAV